MAVLRLETEKEDGFASAVKDGRILRPLGRWCSTKLHLAR